MLREASFDDGIGSAYALSSRGASDAQVSCRVLLGVVGEILSTATPSGDGDRIPGPSQRLHSLMPPRHSSSATVWPIFPKSERI